MQGANQESHRVSDKNKKPDMHETMELEVQRMCQGNGGMDP